MFHILWLNKFEVLHRPLLNAFYRLSGHVCDPGQPADLARVIRRYFDSALYRDGEAVKKRIQEIARED